MGEVSVGGSTIWVDVPLLGRVPVGGQKFNPWTDDFFPILKAIKTPFSALIKIAEEISISLLNGFPKINFCIYADDLTFIKLKKKNLFRRNQLGVY